MKASLILLLSLLSVFAFSQKTLTWKGGTPGNEHDWYEPKNWDKNIVPDEDSYVIIKRLNTGHDAQPVIAEKVIVAYIELQSRSILTISNKGSLILDGSYTYSEGINFYGGQLLNEGVLNLKGIEFSNFNVIAHHIKGNGKTLVNNKPIRKEYAGF
ncbi:MAG: hypothetical protein DWQ02_22615 [Bacteroidetes bacterium]|nr:MAG: hypothetical protein DWQ02_22615 [Bacteroidota bacterium]